VVILAICMDSSCAPYHKSAPLFGVPQEFTDSDSISRIWPHSFWEPRKKPRMAQIIRGIISKCKATVHPMKGDTLSTKIVFQRCILAILAQGFDETDTINLISILRQAGLCVKSMGMTSGLVSGAYGVCLTPDLTLSDLDGLAKTMTFSAVILPENRQCLTKLETDPRLHNFLRQVGSHTGWAYRCGRFGKAISKNNLCWGSWVVWEQQRQ
jgi:hypothetical protein